MSDKSPATKIELKPDGTVIVSLGSINKPGLYSHIEIKDAHNMTERDLYRSVGLCVAELADRQYLRYLDNHDVGGSVLSALEALHKMMKDGTPRVWMNKRFYEPSDVGSRKTIDIPNPSRQNWT